MRGRFFIKIAIIILAAIILVGYAYYQTKNLVLGPQIEITTPKNGSSLQEELLVLEGIAKNISKISINDFPIYIDQKGAFKEKLLLAQGYNVIELSASDRFDRVIDKKLEIVYLSKASNKQQTTNDLRPPIPTNEGVGADNKQATTSNIVN